MVTVRIFEVICEEFYFVGVCKPTDGIYKPKIVHKTV
jgi:hypothetical protein